jgi:DNA polymerase I
VRLFLVSATYNNKRFCVDLIFYNPETEKLVTISDFTGHKPYCLTREEFQPTLDEITATEHKYTISSVERYDSIADMDVNMLKIQAPDPLSIGGNSESIRNRIVTWESDIRYYDRYLYDNELICGLWYDVDDGNISPYKDDSIDFSEVESRLEFGKNKQYDEFVKNWVQILNQSIPDIKRLSVDIEVEYDGDKIPTVNIPNKRITAIGFCSNDGFKRVNVLNPKGDLPNTDTTFYYTSEYKMLVESMDLLSTYPFIITFNGDAFDLPYLYARCSKLNIHYTKIPLTLKTTRIADGAYVDPVYIKNAIHIDLYRFFKNPSIQNYAFSHKYSEFGLDAIAKGLINEAKITHQGSLNTLTPDKLAEYCLNDAEITMKLTTFNDNLFMKLVTMICRISKMPYDDCTRYGANQWGKGMIFSEMVKRNILIPRLDELLIKGTTASKDATIKDKKYAGAFVFTPTKGVYFDVKNVDFASLYPSIIKTNNISFETINCPHQNCMKNSIPETRSWRCQKRDGIISQVIGSLRDLRINYYKFMSKKGGLTEDQRQFYDIISQTLKVIMNASYGILGFESFPLYCLPVAESVTAYGRDVIHKTIDKSRSIGLSVVYGDSVLPDTPIIIKDKNDNIQIIPIESLVPNSYGSCRYKWMNKIKILTDNGFQNILYTYKHIVKKKCYKILTRKSYIECTEDHSLIIDGKEVKPSSLSVGDTIEFIDYSNSNNKEFNNELAWLFGFFIAEGTTGRYSCPSGLKTTWRIVNQDINILKRCQYILRKELGIDTVIRDHIKSSGVYALDPVGSAIFVHNFFKKYCYSNNEKIVPSIILNSNTNTKMAFLEGILSGDGWDDGIYRGLDQIHKSVFSGVINILYELGYDYTINIRSDKPNVLRVRIIKDKNDKRIKNPNQILKLESFEYEGYVYDVSTENSHFCGGVGNVILHNTDSMYVHKADPDKLNQVMIWTKETFGIDLELDKSYRYLVLTELKKNYLGITDKGKADIKGLTGKKSHTPVFIRELFFQVLDILCNIQTEKDVPKARETMSELIRNRVNDLKENAIPFNKLAYNVVVNKNPDSYGKKISSNKVKNLFGEEETIDEYKSLPQHIKAAKMLPNIEAGSVISIIKTRDEDGVKPKQLIKSIDEVDKDKYIDLMANTFSQILDSFKLDFKTIINNSKQLTMDDIANLVVLKEEEK